MRKHRIVEVVGITWGGIMIAAGVTGGVPHPTSSYGAGQTAVYLLAWARFAASLDSFVRKSRRNRRADFEF